MTRHPSDAQLNELVDGTLAPDEQARIARHVADCVPCTASVRALEALVRRARALPREVSPPAEAWGDVREAVRRPRATVPAPARRSRWATVAAAAALVVVSAGVTWSLTSGRAEPRETHTAPTRAVAPASLAAFAPVEARYVLAVSALRETLDDREAQLDPRTIATVERSLATIDSAIAEARTALAADPANATLTRLLASSYEQKVALLRRASELPPRS